jgi:hypothetical protein
VIPGVLESMKQSLLKPEEAILVGYVIQAALPDASFHTVTENQNGAAVLMVQLPGKSAAPITSALVAGRFIRGQV